MHVNPYTGRTALSEPAILVGRVVMAGSRLGICGPTARTHLVFFSISPQAWETGNELQPPANWTGAIAAFIKSIDSNHLVLDGTYGINAEALPLPDVDLYR
jgi:hypothetical protein